jgi:hypothetical protein
MVIVVASGDGFAAVTFWEAGDPVSRLMGGDRGGGSVPPIVIGVNARGERQAEGGAGEGGQEA